MARDKTDKTDLTPAATTATRATNEWGIPDWRDPLAYGDVKRWTFFRWRWEFYRRRGDLQEIFDAVYRWELKNFGPLERPVRGEPGCYTMVNGKTKREFGYPFLPDPAVGNHPEELLVVLPTDAPLIDMQVEGFGETAFDELVGLGLIDPENPYENADFLKHQKLVPLNPNHRLVGFEIEKPLTSQLEMATNYLRNLQKWKLGCHPQVKRRHPSKWLDRLRALDAREADASWREIAIALLPMRKDEAGEQVHARETKARDLWEAADALRFNL